MNLAGKRILIGIGGGVAVYRIAELTRLLKKSGAQVRCIMTRSATEFVSQLTFEALSGEKVHTELFDLTSEREMGHIQLARWADVVLIAPATANLIARLTHGIADDLLTTTMQVCDRPALLAPAMNSSMWESDATSHNIGQLQQRGMHLIGPATGELACGESGPGRLSEISDIFNALLPLLHEQKLAGQKWVINAGPTVEAWDAVRLLSNRASGKLGSIIADTAAVLGADVTLIAGPGTPVSHPLVTRLDIESADQMLAQCLKAAPHADTFIATAAVSDFRFRQPHHGKLKRGDTADMQVDLVANPDIVATIAAMEERPARVIAFAAESSDHVTHARIKLAGKQVDAVIANDVANMGSDRAGGWWVTTDSANRLDAESKTDFAELIIQHIMEISHEP